MKNNINRQCAFIPAEAFALLLTAYFKKQNQPFILITPDSLTISAITATVIEEAGGLLFKKSQVLPEVMGHIDHIWVHSFGQVDLSCNLIEEYGLDYSIYSDALKNEISKVHVDKHFPDYQALLSFGFLWYKDFLKPEVPLKICTFSDIISVFDEVIRLSGIKSMLTEQDYKKDWVFLRYWGEGKGKFKLGYNYASVIAKYLLEQKVDSVLIKGDSRIKAITTGQLIEALKQSFSVERMDDKFNIKNFSINNKDNFFAEAMISSKLKGRVHVFDSSLSIYIALTTSSKVIFPSQSLINDVFNEEKIAKNVYFYSCFYKTVCQYVELLKKEQSFSKNNFFVIKREINQFVVSQTFKIKANTIGNIIQRSAFSNIDRK